MTVQKYNRIKILNISEEGRFAGPQRRVCNIAPILSDKYDITVEVLFPRQHSGQFQRALEKEGITFYIRTLHKLTKQWSQLLFYLVSFFPEIVRICNVIKQSKPDIVESNNGSWCIKAVIAARLCGVKSIWYLNDTYMPTLIVKVFRFVYHFFSDHNVMFASNRTKEFYFPKSSVNQLKKYITIQAPVNSDYFSPNRMYSFPFDDAEYNGIRVLSVGNVNPIKNHSLIIHAAKVINEMYPGFDVRFYIVGHIYESQTDYYRKLLVLMRELGVNNIEFMGGSSQVRELLYYSDMFVCSSSYEGSPNAVWEALSMGKAVLSTDVGDVKEIFDKYKCGVICDENDLSEWANQIVKVGSNEALRITLGQNARRTILDVFHIDKVASKYATFYQDVAVN